MSNILSFMKNVFQDRKKSSSIPSPEMINLCIRTICNLKCKMCYNWQPPKIKPVLFSPKQWKSVISDLRKEFPEKNIALAFTGSESLLYPDIFELIGHARKIGFDVWLHTNGTLINERTVNLLKNTDLKNVSLSLDSIIPEEHNLMRGSEKSYEQVIKAIDLLYDGGITTLNINTVLCSYNIKNIEKLVQWVQDNPKLFSITLQAVSQPFNTPPELEWQSFPEYSHLWPKDIKVVEKVLESIIKNKKEYTKLINKESQLEIFKKYFRQPGFFVKHYGCSVGSKQLNIGPAGNVAICLFQESGNLHKQKIGQLWNSDFHKNLYLNMAKCTQNCHLLINCAYEEEIKP